MKHFLSRLLHRKIRMHVAEFALALVEAVEHTFNAYEQSFQEHGPSGPPDEEEVWALAIFSVAFTVGRLEHFQKLPHRTYRALFLEFCCSIYARTMARFHWSEARLQEFQKKLEARFAEYDPLLSEFIGNREKRDGTEFHLGDLLVRNIFKREADPSESLMLFMYVWAWILALLKALKDVDLVE